MKLLKQILRRGIFVRLTFSIDEVMDFVKKMGRKITLTRYGGNSKMKRWRYFTEDEFRCHCCGKLIIDDKLIDLLDKAREIAGVPFIVVSGYRCKKHNAEVGGKPNSAHLVGKAADIKATDSRTRFKIVQALVKVGFHRIGIAKGFIHCDIDDSKPPEVLWLY